VPYLDASLTLIYEMPVRVLHPSFSASVVEPEEGLLFAEEEAEMTFRCT